MILQELDRRRVKRKAHYRVYFDAKSTHILPNKLSEIDGRFRSTRYRESMKRRNIYNGN